MELLMRTRLDIDDDVLLVAREIAKREKKLLGTIISNLARQTLQVSERLAQYGIKPLPARGGIVSNELINLLRDAEGI
jgi:hypothetical protein